MKLQMVRLAEGDVYYLEGGGGSDILFLHGAIATAEAYIPLLDLLASRYHVIAPIHPGHGKTFALPHGWKLQNYVIFYRDFLAEIGSSPHIVIGHSFGGTITLLLAADRLGDTAVAMDAPGLRFQFDATEYANMLLHEGRDILRHRPDLQTLAEASKVAGTFMQTVIRHPNDVSLLSRLAPKYDIGPIVKKITIPVSLLWGQNDPIVPVEMGKRLHMLIPGATLTVLPGLGHNYPVTEPSFTYMQLLKILDA